MRLKFVFVFLLVGTLPTFSYSADRPEFGFSLGIPAGFMDYSANIMISKPIEHPVPWNPEIILNRSFGHKKDPNSDGLMIANVMSLYLVKEFSLTMTSVTFKLSPGFGSHFINSYFSGEGALSGMSSLFKWTNKSHLLFGVEIKSLIIEGRLTFPSDLLLDTWYVGYRIQI